MSEEQSLALDVDAGGSGEKAYQVTRVAVVGIQGITRDGSASTITADCRSLAALQREIDRLQGELEQTRQDGALAYGAEPEPSRAEPNVAPQSDAAATPAKSQVALELPASARVGDVMTRDVATVLRNDKLSLARERMESGGFRHVVVIDAPRSVVGVLSLRDIFFGPLAWSLGQGKHGYEASLERGLVKEVMGPEVLTIDAQEPLAVASRLMVEHKVGCLPVVQADELVGIITESDFLELIASSNAPRDEEKDDGS